MNLPYSNVEEPWLYPEDEGELVQAAQRDPKEFLSLSRPLYFPIYRYLFTRLGSAAEAEEAAIQIFIEAYAQLVRGKRGRSYPARLVTLAAQHSPHPVSAGAFPTDTYNEELDQLSARIQSLDEDDRELLRMRYAAGLSEKTIAKIRRLGVKAVQQRLNELGLDLERHMLGYEPVGAVEPSALTQQRIAALFAAVTVPAGLAERLENRVLDHIASQPHTIKRRVEGGLAWTRRRAWGVALGLAVFALAIVVMSSPQQILRAGQNLIASLPGVRYVNLDGSRVLESPVSVSRQGVRLVVTRVMAYSEGTEVSFISLGLPRRRADMNVQMGQFTLILKDGQILNARRMELHLGQARLEFPPIPLGENEVTLRVDRLPLARHGSAPEGWDIPLALRKANADDPAERPPTAYSPSGAEASTNGLTLQVVQVSQSSEETAVEVKVKTADPNWKVDASGIVPRLQDALGNLYHQQDGDTAGVVIEQVQQGPFGGPVAVEDPGAVKLVYRYAPLSGKGDKAQFQVGTIPVTIPISTGFLFKPAEAMKPGQEWIMNDEIDVLGIPVTLKSAYLQKFQDTSDGYYQLNFKAEVEQPENREIESISYSANPGRATGPIWTGAKEISFQVILPYLPRADDPVEIRFTEVEMKFAGPWEVQWKLPSSAPQPSAKVVNPQDAVTSAGGISLALERAELGAFFTQLNLRLGDLPGAIEGALSLMEGENEPILFDTWEVPHSLSCDEKIGKDSSIELSFPPLTGEDSRFTLVLPALLLTLPAAGSDSGELLSLDVPEIQELRSNPSAQFVHLDSQWTPRGWVAPSDFTFLSSPSWDVAACISIGGYRVEFDNAQVDLDPIEGGRCHLTVFGHVQGGSRLGKLVGLTVDRVTTPGAVWTVETGDEPIAQVTVQDENVFLQIDLSLPGSRMPPPGAYSVHFSAAQVELRGPWRIEVPLKGL